MRDAAVGITPASTAADDLPRKPQQGGVERQDRAARQRQSFEHIASRQIRTTSTQSLQSARYHRRTTVQLGGNRSPQAGLAEPSQ